MVYPTLSRFDYRGHEERVPTGREFGIDYDSLHEAMTDVRDVCVLNLATYVTRLPVEYASGLIPEPPGVYLHGSLHPLLTFGPETRAYSQSQFHKNPACPDIVSFDTFVQCHETVVDRHGHPICHRPAMMRHRFLDHCVFNYSAIHLAAIEVWELLSCLHRETRPSTNIGLQHLSPEQYLLPDIDLRRFNLNSQPGLDTLRDHVLNFIGRDVCALYTLKLQNTTLYLEKGNDYRVIEYYRGIFEDLESKLEERFGF